MHAKEYCKKTIYMTNDNVDMMKNIDDLGKYGFKKFCSLYEK